MQIWRSRPMQGFCGLDSHSPGPHDADEPILARKCEREDVNPSRTLVAQMLSLSHSSPTLASRAQQTFARSIRAPSGKLLPTAANRSHMPWQSTVTFKNPASVGLHQICTGWLEQLCWALVKMSPHSVKSLRRLAKFRDVRDSCRVTAP